MPIYRGAKYSKYPSFADRSTRQPVPINGWEFEMVLRSDAGAELLTMSTADGHFSVSSAENGQFRIYLTAEQTADLPLGNVNGALMRTDEPDGPTRIGTFKDIVLDLE